MTSELTLSLFLIHFRRQLVEYRVSAQIDQATPGEVLDAVVRCLDNALKATKGAQANSHTVGKSDEY